MAVVTPVVYDTRPEGHGSFGVLPELGRDEYDRLADFYGFIHLTQHGHDRASNGQKYFRLWGIELKAGPAVFQPLILTPADPPNSRQEGTLVWNSWPGAADIPGNAEGPHYKSVGVHCWSDATGSCGWGYGGGSHIGACSTSALMASAQAEGIDLFTLAADVAPGAMVNDHATVLYAMQNLVGYTNPKGEDNPDGQDIADYKDDLALMMAASGNCGVHTFWCNSGGGFVGSDGFDRVGWWDDHITPNPMFLADTKGGGGGPDPEGDYFFVVVDAQGNGISYVAMKAGSPGSPAPAGGYIGLLNARTDEIEYYVETSVGSPS